MAAQDDHDSVLDAHREQVSRPLLRLFRAYATGEARWLVLGSIGALLYANLWGVQAGEIDPLSDEFLAHTSDSASDV